VAYCLQKSLQVPLEEPLGIMAGYDIFAGWMPFLSPNQQLIPMNAC